MMQKSQELAKRLVTTEIHTDAATKADALQSAETPQLTQSENTARRSSDHYSTRSHMAFYCS